MGIFKLHITFLSVLTALTCGVTKNLFCHNKTVVCWYTKRKNKGRLVVIGLKPNISIRKFYCARNIIYLCILICEQYSIFIFFQLIIFRFRSTCLNLCLSTYKFMHSQPRCVMLLSCLVCIILVVVMHKIYLYGPQRSFFAQFWLLMFRTQ